MTKKELQDLVRQGEHSTLEFKKKVAHPEKIVREVVAFANSQGGTLLVGVADNGELSGIPYPEEEMWVLDNAIKKLCKPPINFNTESIAIDGRWVVRYQIEEGDRKPYYVLEKQSLLDKATAPFSKAAPPFRKKTYIRKNDRSIQASREMREILRRRNQDKDVGIKWGEAEQVLMKYLAEHNTITVKQFAKIAHIKRNIAAGILIRIVLAGVIRIIPSEGEDHYVAVHMD
jgi:predicted HTH transcriptional regulator